MNKFLIPTILAATILVAGIFALAPMEKASTVHTTITGQIATVSFGDNVNLETANADIEIIAGSATVKKGFVCVDVEDPNDDFDSDLRIEITAAGDAVQLLSNGNIDVTDGCAEFVAYRLFIPDDIDTTGSTVDFLVQYTESNT